ncbi:MAG TPA: replication factor C large subunit [Candidatus Paceibacterota bacterium]|nr:replication factor C large subunit [Candidatus Paceibacterota bacterium]
MEKIFNNLCEKYRVNCFQDLKGQDKAIEEIKKFFNEFPKSKKAAILHGPTGIGKTSIAHIIKKEFNLEIFELNASDFRNKEQLQIKLKPASEQKSLFNKGKILLVDEVDGLSTRTDEGGLSELIRLIEETQFPIIITANDIWDQKFKDLRKSCKIIALKEINYKEISTILQEIARKENIPIDNQAIIAIAVRAKGDVRAAINDFQIISSEKDATSNYLFANERNKEIDIFNALKLIFKNLPNEETIRVYDSVNLPLDKIFLWVEENIPYEYSGEELAKAYEILSLADLFRGRIMRQRYWRFLVYENIFLSAGISNSKKRPKTGFTHYQQPTRILKIWLNNTKNKHKKTIIMKYAIQTHCSKAKASKEFNVIKPILKNPKIQSELKLNEQEIEYINKLN